MHKSTISLATLIATAFCSMPAYPATSDSIFSAGLISSSSSSSTLLFKFEQQDLGPDVGFSNKEQADTESHFSSTAFTHEDLSGFPSLDEQHMLPRKQRLADNVWLPTKLADFSHDELTTAIYVDSFEWDSSSDEWETEGYQIHDFSFSLEADPMADKPLVIKGLRQYLALEDEADFDFKVLRGRVINLSTDPLEYSIMNDLCFIKHCFF